MGLAARKSVLEELGYRITTATNGPDALNHFANHSFDLIVTDYKMPHMTGIELIERIRTGNDMIPVILLSGFAEALGLTEANTGANIVIQKNAHEVAHLTRAVARLLRKKPQRKPVGSATAAPKVRSKAV
jgi:CheY-like chemotaxis protein